MNDREIRGYAIIAKGETPKRIEKNVFKIHSQSNNGEYIVSRKNGEWHCTCPDHKFRKVECKHINAVKFYLKLKEKMEEEGIFELKQSKEVKECVYCHSTDIIKYGKRKTKFGVKQIYKCKNCSRRFVINEIKSIGSDPKIITLVLDLYFKGLSQRKIVDHLKQFYHLSVHQTTVMRWIKRFTKLIGEYVKDLSPETSKRWHVDEMMVKTNGEWSWIWNCMDEDTRFMLASVITKGRRRDVDDARKPLREAKKIAKEKPEVIITDGLPSYIRAFKKEFFTLRNPRTKHVRDIHFTNPDWNNNIVERLQGTCREREKVMRGMKELERSQEIIDGFKIYYNFVRPHQSLNGLTPAEVAGINLELGENKWYGLLKLSIENRL